MADNPKFSALLSFMGELHQKKNADYASDNDPYSNFKEAGEMAKGFTDPIDIVFATLIGIKMARLRELKGKGKTPNNESVSDTQVDLAMYAALWASYTYPVPIKEQKGAWIPTPGCYCEMCRIGRGEMLPVSVSPGSLSPQSSPGG